jgi:hypothetical protein
MNQGTLFDARDSFRRERIARRAYTLAPVVPSQDVSRYPAKDMPRPTYDLIRADPAESRLTLVIVAITAAATGAGILIVQTLGAWLAR